MGCRCWSLSVDAQCSEAGVICMQRSNSQIRDAKVETRNYPQPHAAAAISTTAPPIAMEAVAAGEGTL
jgi:hypothetical protein